MPHYPDEASLHEARARYFEANEFGEDGGYDDSWVRLKVGPFPVAFPNTPGRKAAVPCHDLHHVATGFDTDLAGEAEIGAWEIASGCAHVRAAFVLNALVAWPVLFFALGRLYRAFVWGRHTANLYDGSFSDALLEKNVGQLRAQLRLDEPRRPGSLADKLAFATYVSGVVTIQVVIVIVFFGLPAWLLGAFD